MNRQKQSRKGFLAGLVAAAAATFLLKKVPSARSSLKAGRSANTGEQGLLARDSRSVPCDPHV